MLGALNLSDLSPMQFQYILDPTYTKHFLQTCVDLSTHKILIEDFLLLKSEVNLFLNPWSLELFWDSRQLQ